MPFSLTIASPVCICLSADRSASPCFSEITFNVFVVVVLFGVATLPDYCYVCYWLKEIFGFVISTYQKIAFIPKYELWAVLTTKKKRNRCSTNKAIKFCAYFLCLLVRRKIQAPTKQKHSEWTKNGIWSSKSEFSWAVRKTPRKSAH